MKKNDFNLKANLKHSNEYDYSLVNYINNKVSVDIICKKHGIFNQMSSDHLRGAGCPDCGFERSSELRNAIAKDSFINKSIKLHNNKYNYSLVEYVDSVTKVNIICPIHGVFEITPNKHLKKRGCSKCSFDERFGTTKEFIDKSNVIHNNKYDYSLIEYITAKTKVKIICCKHGMFEQTPNDHLSKHGCPTCNSSQGELNIIKILEEHSIKYINQKKFDGCINKRKLSFDFYLPDYNICIEYDGIQHFESIEYFGGDKEFEYVKHKDSIKNNYCLSNNIKLFRIGHHENLLQEMNNIISFLNH